MSLKTRSRRGSSASPVGVAAPGSFLTRPTVSSTPLANAIRFLSCGCSMSKPTPTWEPVKGSYQIGNRLWQPLPIVKDFLPVKIYVPIDIVFEDPVEPPYTIKTPEGIQMGTWIPTIRRLPQVQSVPAWEGPRYFCEKLRFVETRHRMLTGPHYSGVDCTRCGQTFCVPDWQAIGGCVYHPLEECDTHMVIQIIAELYGRYFANPPQWSSVRSVYRPENWRVYRILLGVRVCSFGFGRSTQMQRYPGSQRGSRYVNVRSQSAGVMRGRMGDFDYSLM